MAETERALGIGNATLYARDFEGNLIMVRMEQGDRKGVKFVPMPGSVIGERFSSHEILLLSGTTAAAQDFVVNSYAIITALNQPVDLEPFNAFECTVTVVVKVKVTSGDEAFIRIKDEDGNVVGAEQTSTSVSYEAKTFTWTEANVKNDTFKVDAYVDAGQGTIYVESVTISDTYARPVVEAEDSTSPGALTVTLDTKGYPFVSYMYDTDDAGTGSITFEISNDNSAWKVVATHTPGGAKIEIVDVTTGFRYVRLKSTDATATQEFWISAKR